MLRPYQNDLKTRIYDKYRAGSKNVLAVMPCGGGKTVVMASIFGDRPDIPAIAIAHRQELVAQISLTLARYNLRHRIIAPAPTIRFIVQLHIEEFNRSYYEPMAALAVAGVDTINRRGAELESFFRRVALWQTDEGHHLQATNKWGAAVARMPHAFGLGWTATPARADRKSLRDVYDALVSGPPMRDLITAGFLADYRIYGPPSDIHLERVGITSGGDFKPDQLRTETRSSAIIGDVVTHYLRICPGARHVTFAVDVEMAKLHADAFNQAGVPAAWIAAEGMNGRERADVIARFRRGDIKELVNVDILGEGFDCPGIEAESMARATASYPLFEQQFCRTLRPMRGKTHGVIIDHVGNVDRHGLPDAPKAHTLDMPPKREKLEDDIPIRTCPNPGCFRVFEGYGKTCPYCGFRPEAQGRGRPEMLDGDLTEYHPDTLARMRREADRVMRDISNMPVRSAADHVIKDNHGVRRDAQAELRQAIAVWAGVQRANDFSDADAYVKFNRRFGVDVLTAQTLSARQAAELQSKIHHEIWTDAKQY